MMPGYGAPDGADLLDSVRGFVGRFVAFPWAGAM